MTRYCSIGLYPALDPFGGQTTDDCMSQTRRTIRVTIASDYCAGTLARAATHKASCAPAPEGSELNGTARPP